MIPIDHPSEPLLTPAEVADRLRMKVGWVYRHAAKLGGIKLGKYWRFNWITVSQRLQHPPRSPSPEKHPRDEASI
jgi:hypothetical protein